MYLHKKITNLPVNDILAEGIEFKLDKKRQGFRLVVGGDILWDFPWDFAEDAAPSANYWNGTIGDTTWHNFHLSDLYKFLKSYLDTPRDKLDDFSEDYCGLRDALLAADKRRGRHPASILMFSTDSAVARKIIHYRFGRKPRAQA